MKTALFFLALLFVISCTRKNEVKAEKSQVKREQKVVANNIKPEDPLPQ